MNKKDLKPNEYNEYFANYINLVADNTNLFEGYILDKNYVINFFKEVPERKLNYAYAENKWNIKEILQHLIDTERIFMYRFLRIARNDKTNLKGFDQDIFIAPSLAKEKSLNELLEEFKTTRDYSINLIKSIPTKHLSNIGVASDSKISARACAFLLLGHSIWHINIIKQRYL